MTTEKSVAFFEVKSELAVVSLREHRQRFAGKKTFIRTMCGVLGSNETCYRICRDFGLNLRMETVQCMVRWPRRLSLTFTPPLKWGDYQ